MEKDPPKQPPQEPEVAAQLSQLDNLEPAAQAQLIADLIANRQLGQLPTNSLDSLFLTTLQRCTPALESIAGSFGWNDDGAGPSRSSPKKISQESLDQYLDKKPAERTLLQSCSTIYEAAKALETFKSIWPASFLQTQPEPEPPTETQGEANEQPQAVESGSEEAIELDDPWAEGDIDETGIEDPWEADAAAESSSAPVPQSESAQLVTTDAEGEEDEEPPIPLSDFMAQPIPLSAAQLASFGALRAVKVILQRHPDVWRWRFAILDALPSWISPHDLQDNRLLPHIGADAVEAMPATSTPVIGAEQLPYATFLESLPPSFDYALLPPPLPEPLPSDELEQWYRDKIASLDLVAGVDIQLAWVQHAASLGVTGLDRIGEDLSLLSRLVYDSHLSVEAQASWTLSSWQSADPGDIVTAYLSNSTPSSIVSDIKRLILPYLYVLESRAERAGEADKGLVDRRLFDAILGLPLATALAVFEASKATLSKRDRIVKDDMAVARLALACLYGSDERNAWSTMSAIFECLPVWELSGTNPEDDRELTSTTLDSIATFVRPTVRQPKPPKAKDLFIFFQPLPFASLSRALDILDVHLESGEALARWDVPVQPRFLLQSARDAGEQNELAEKMVRRAVAGSNGGVNVRDSRGGEKMEEMRWARLWDDMVKLNGAGDALLRGAFGMIPAEDVMRVYLGGILRSGKLEVAKKMVHRLQDDHGLSEATLEEVVLSVSRELYENAETGNIHSGDMKLAYDCLSAAAPSKAIQDERAFIEATSRLTTFALPSSRGGHLTPVEIRHTKHKLDLIALVLKTSRDSYRHDELLIDLARKLGYGTKEDEGLVLAQLASAAGQAEDWNLDLAYCRRLVDIYREVSRRGHRRGDSSSTARRSLDQTQHGGEESRLRDAAWKTFFELGNQGEFSDIPGKMSLLSWALEFCPPAEIPFILEAWRKVEDGSLKLSAAAKRRRLAGTNRKSGATHGRNASINSVGSVGSPMPGGDTEKRVLGSRTAARAARLAMDFGERWRFGGVASPILGSDGGKSSPRGSFSQTERPGSAASWRSDEGRRSQDGERPLGLNVALEDAERVRQGVRRGIVKGVGWLLGAEEGEL